MKKVIAKFECREVTHTVDGKSVSMAPVTDDSPENAEFFRWTPFGSLEMGIVNPEVEFTPGKKYYVEFTEAMEG